MSELKAGFWSVDITPSMDVSAVGNWTPRSITDYLEPLRCNAVVIDDGKSRLAIVSVEIGMLATELTEQTRQEIEKRCGIPARNVILVATHIHSGPEGTADETDIYSQNLKMQMVTSVWMAAKKLEPVRIGIGKATNTDFVHNRRLTDESGQIAMNWLAPELVQDCVEDLTRRDTDVFALRFESPEGKVRGIILNYANHNNARGGTAVNSDIGGYIAKKMRAVYGEDVVSVLLLGACGNVNFINHRDMTWNKNPWNYRRIAESLMGNFFSIFSMLEYVDGGPLRAVNRQMMMMERDFNAYDEVIDRTFNYKPQGGLEAVRDAMKAQPLRELLINLSLLTIGRQIAIITVSGELFAEYALRLKETSPYKHTIVCELSNGTVNYICTPDSYEKGGYEVRKPATLLEYGAGDIIWKAMEEMLRESWESGR